MKQPPPLHFANFWIPEEVAPQNFLFTGAGGTGKTIQLKQLVQSILKGCAVGKDTRLLLYDFKAELFGFLWEATAQFTKGVPFYCFNPADRRSVWWHMAMDVPSEVDCHQMASTLVPMETGEKNPYFTLATRNIIAQLMISFMRHSPKVWFFRDLLCALSSPELYRRVLSRDEDTATALRIGSEETAANVDTTINNVFNHFSPLAAYMDHAQRAKHPPFSIRYFMRTPGVLLLPMDPTLVVVLEPFFRMFLYLLTQQVLALPESDSRRTWLILDEFHTLKPIESFPNFVTNGRSKGACHVLALQHVQSITNTNHYGKVGEAILGEMKNRVFLQAGTHDHAVWCADEYGKSEFVKTSVSFNEGFSEQSSGDSKHSTVTQSVGRNFSKDFESNYLRLPSEFQSLSLVRNSGIIEGYSVVMGRRIPVRVTLADALAGLLKPEVKHPGFVRVKAGLERLRGWTADDYERLKIPPPPQGNVFDAVMNLKPPPSR